VVYYSKKASNPRRVEPIWGKPPGAVKAHFFVKGKTACGSKFFGQIAEAEISRQSDCCVICGEVAAIIEAKRRMMY